MATYINKGSADIALKNIFVNYLKTYEALLFNKTYYITGQLIN